MTKKVKLIIVFGGILIALRLFFPVLQCNSVDDADCSKGRITFFSVQQPIPNYVIHSTRNYTEAAGIAVLTAVLVAVSYKKKKV